MTKLSRALGFIISIALFGSFFYLIYIFVISLPSIIAGTGGIAPVVAAFGIPIIGNFLLKWFEKRKEKKDKIELDFRDKKLDACEKMLSKMYASSLNDEVKKNLQLPQNDLEWQMLAHEYMNAMLLWGSKKSIEDWVKFTKDVLEESKDDIAPIRRAASLMLSIRKEMGHNDQLKEEDLMKFLIKSDEWYLIKEKDSRKEEKSD